ncbi:HAMP domain-containing histidine kinase [Vibrio tubiashii]|uniref:histidine kinase n=1 Tax=Vibrio tubiashii TaxID=29498 RepID=A0AAE5GMP6_9VIBR|nr:HAMP domain-containing sensor histidine kinase [Vibrio tubiashii]NOI79387.1 HAMP domain-containing histidine kinase [Vibrio tubiashii]
MKMLKSYFKAKRGNSIEDVKARLLTTFSAIALTTSFLVFFAFSIRLVFHEDNQIENHLKSFQDIAIRHYQLEQVAQASISKYVTAYYDTDALPSKFKAQMPYKLGEVTRFRSFNFDGYMVYHLHFNYQDQQLPLYLTIDSRAIDFGDDSWDALMAISMILMIFLIIVLRFSLKRVFDGLMSPISSLTEQLAKPTEEDFSTSNHAIDEIQQLTHHLNSYKHMKERLAKQELMFAKYASHELKTPIAVVLGAANLQAMKEDAEFQAKQRQRILTAGARMQETVEVLLNIVKQENASNIHQEYELLPEHLELERFHEQLSPDVELTYNLERGCEINLPPSIMNMVLKNLVENAIRFTTYGQIEIDIKSNNIRVIDTGKGLNSEPETDHGLGLLIVKRICQSYGWQFRLENNPKQQGCLAAMTRSHTH